MYSVLIGSGESFKQLQILVYQYSNPTIAFKKYHAMALEIIITEEDA